MSEFNKQNDWLVGLAMSGGLNLILDFYTAGYTPENTQLKSKEFYQNSKFILDNFTDASGNFDQAGFDNLYKQAASSYQVFANNNRETLMEQVEYNFNNVFRPKDSTVRLEYFELKRMPNPTKQYFGTQGINSVRENHFTHSELAQAARVIDFDTGKTLDWTPNDKGGVFGLIKGSLPTWLGGNDPLVFAQWDEDGWHDDPVTGQKQFHYAGDFRLNEDGDLCYETLGKRDVARKQVLSGWDTLTVDGSYWNKFDPFDADGRDKSIGGTLARAALKMAPYVIGAYTGGVGNLIANGYFLTTALMNLAGTAPTLYKALENAINGGDGDYESKSGMWRAMNSLAASMATTNFNQSEYAKSRMFSFEGIVNMIADSWILLGLQSVMASIPRYLKMQNAFDKIEDFNEFSKAISIGYNTITAGTGAYERAIQNGHSERTAGMITLGTVIGLNRLFSSGEYALWYLKQLGLDGNTRFMKPIVQGATDRIRQGMASTGNGVAAAAAAATTEKGKLTFLKSIADNFFNYAKKAIDNPITITDAAFNEGLEEITEEFVEDMMHAMGAMASSMGITKKVDTSFDLTETLSRYAMAGIGGAIGGSLHHFNLRWNKIHQAVSSAGDDKNLIEAIARYGANEVKAMINRDFNKKAAYFGDYNLSTDYDKESSTERLNFLSVSNGDIRDSQAFKVKQNMIELVNAYDSILKGLDVDLSALKDIANMMPPELRAQLEVYYNLGMEDAIHDQLNYYATEIVRETAKLLEYEEGTPEYNQINKRISELKLKRSQVVDAKHFEHFLLLAVLQLEPNLKDLFIDADINKFAISKTGKRFDELSEYEKSKILEDYALYSSRESTGVINRHLLLEHAVDILNYYNKGLLNSVQNFRNNYKAIRKITYENFESGIIQNLAYLLKMFDEFGNVNTDIYNRFRGIKFNPDDYVLHDKDQVDDSLELTKGTEAITDADILKLRDIILTEGLDSVRAISLARLISVKQQLKAYEGLPIDALIIEAVSSYRNDVLDVVKMATEKETAKQYDDEGFNHWSIKDAANFSRKGILNNIALQLGNNVLDIKDSDINNYVDNLNIDIAAIVQDYKNNGGEMDEDTFEIVYGKFAEMDFESFEALTPDLQLEQFKKALKNQLKNTFKGLNQYKYDALQVQEVNDMLRNSADHPVFDFLDKLSKMNGSDNEAILKVLKEEFKKVYEGNFDQYIASNPKKLLDTLDDIKILAGLLEAQAINENGENTCYNRIINTYRQLLGIDLFLPEMSYDEKNMILRDLLIIHNKLDFCLKLSNYNQTNVFGFHLKTAARFYSLFAEMYNEDPSNRGLMYQINDALLAKLGNGVDLMKGISEILAEDRDVTAILTEKMKQQAESKVSDDDLAKAELLLTRLETKLHENFQEIYEQHFKGKEDDLMAVLLKQFPIVKGDTKSIIECKTSEISDKTKALTDFDKVVYLTTTLAANCGEYKTKLYKAINTDDFKFAPLFAQEYPVRLAYAAAKNPALFNAVLNQFKDNNGKLIYPNLYNTIFIEGYHGVGKTSATANILNKILLDGDPDSFTYSAIIQRQVDKLKASLGANEALTMDLMISEILNGNGKVGDYFENGNFKNILTDKVLELVNKNNNSKLKKYIIIDEATHYNATDLKLLSEYCRLSGRVLFLMGDNLQEGALKNIQYFAAISSPIIEFSLRSGVSTVKNNCDNIRTITKELDIMSFDQEQGHGLKEMPARFKSWLNNDLNLKHGKDGHGLFVGINSIDIDNSDQEVRNLVTQALAQGIDPKDIAIFTDKLEQSQKQALEAIAQQHGLTMVDARQVQGAEFQYAIIAGMQAPPVNGTPDAVLAYAKKLNTLFSRAARGTLILSKKGQDGKVLFLDKIGVDKYPTDLKNDSEAFREKSKQFKDQRLKALEAIATQLGNYTAPALPAQPAQPGTSGTGAGTGTGSGPIGPGTPLTGGTGGGTPLVNGTSTQLLASVAIQLMGGTNGSLEITETLPGNNQTGGDLQVLGYTSSNFYGLGFMKDGKLGITPGDLPMIYDEMRFDLEIFMDENHNIDGETILDSNGTLKKDLRFKYNKLRKKLLAWATSNRDTNELIKLFDEFDFPMPDFERADLDFENAKIGIIYSEYDPEVHYNMEAGNDAKAGGLHRRLVLRIPSKAEPNGTNDALFTLGFIGSKKGDAAVEAIENKILDELKAIGPVRAADGAWNYERYIWRVIDKDGIKTTGTSTRSNKNVKKNYTLEELQNDGSFISLSNPMILTGKTEATLQLYNPLEDEAKADLIDEIIESYKLNGRPVVFVSRDLKTEGWDSSKLARHFFMLKLAQLGDPSAQGTEHLVEMVCLNMAVNTSQGPLTNIESFFLSYRRALDAFKNNPTQAKGMIESTSHKFMGLSMIRAIFEANDQIRKNNLAGIVASGWEKSILITLGKIEEMLKLKFRLVPKEVEVGGKKLIHVALLDKVNNKTLIAPTEQDVLRLNEVINEVNPGTSNSDIRHYMYENYYKGFRNASDSSKKFDFNDIVFTLLEMVDSGFKDENGVWLKTNKPPKELLDLMPGIIHTDPKTGNVYNNIKEALILALSGEYHYVNNTTGKTADFKIQNYNARFKNGVEHHAYLMHTSSDASSLEWVHLAGNPLNQFIVPIHIDSLRVLVDYSKMFTENKYQEEIKKRQQSFDQQKANYLNTLQSLNLPSQVYNQIKSIIDNLTNPDTFAADLKSKVEAIDGLKLLPNGKLDLTKSIPISFELNGNTLKANALVELIGLKLNMASINVKEAEINNGIVTITAEDSANDYSITVKREGSDYKVDVSTTPKTTPLGPGPQPGPQPGAGTQPGSGTLPGTGTGTGAGINLSAFDEEGGGGEPEGPKGGMPGGGTPGGGTAVTTKLEGLVLDMNNEMTKLGIHLDLINFVNTVISAVNTFNPKTGKLIDVLKGLKMVESMNLPFNDKFKEYVNEVLAEKC